MAALYTLTVTSLTRGWTYTVVQGAATAATVLPRVALAVPFEYSWSFEDDQIPGSLDPCRARITLAAATADDVPTAYVGDLITVDLRVDTAGPRIVAPPPLRISEAAVDLDPDDPRYTAVLDLTLVDLLVDLPSIRPQRPVQPDGSYVISNYIAWRPRLAEIALTSGVSIGCPTWWDDNAGPQRAPAGDGLTQYGLQFNDGVNAFGSPKFDAAAVITAMLNSHQPQRLTHTLTPAPRTAHAPGWRRIGPETSWESRPALPDPASTNRYAVVPASRRCSGAAALPLSLALVDGRIDTVPRLTPTQPTDGTTTLGLDAAWCEVPARARRSREHITERVVLTGGTGFERNISPQGSVFYAGTEENAERSYGAGGAPNSRSVPVALFFTSIDGNGVQFPEPGNVAPLFLSDATATQAAWTYDDFTLYASRVPDASRALVLPRIAPRLPGEPDGDNHLVRHVTLAGLDPTIRFNAMPALGFVTRGTLTATDDDLTFTLGTTPGEPLYQYLTPTPITVGTIQAAAYSTTAASAVDPDITIADLDYIAA